MASEVATLPQGSLYVRVLPAFPTHYSSQAVVVGHPFRNDLYLQEQHHSYPKSVVTSNSHPRVDSIRGVCH